jgi:hypothetical protein
MRCRNPAHRDIEMHRILPLRRLIAWSLPGEDIRLLEFCPVPTLPIYTYSVPDCRKAISALAYFLEYSPELPDDPSTPGGNIGFMDKDGARRIQTVLMIRWDPYIETAHEAILSSLAGVDPFYSLFDQ